MLRSLSVEDIRLRGTIRDSDVARLQRAYDDGHEVTADDAEALIQLHSVCPIKDPSWARFLVEALSDYVVNQATPEGYVVAENARWLIEAIGPFGRIETSTEMALLVHVIERARWTPPSLATFGLRQICHAIESGTGPLRAAEPAPAGCITEGEIDLTARFIAAFGGETGIPVTRAEADCLIALNRTIDEGQGSARWDRLFIDCVGTAVLAALGHSVPSRSAFWREQAAEPLDPSAGRPEAIAPVGVWSTAPLMSPEERALARLERQRLEIVTNEVIEEATEIWLMARLGEADRLRENELALLRFIQREASRLPKSLDDFAARALLAA